MKFALLMSVVCFLAFVSLPGRAAEHPRPHPQRDRSGPDLIGKGEGYAIYALDGMVQTDGVSTVLAHGISIFHIDKQTDEATWLIRTGTVAIPTRRASFILSRLVGVLQNQTHLYAVIYRLRTWDEPPGQFELDPQQGDYVIQCFEKKTGRRIQGNIRLHPKTKRPEQLPGETIHEGVFKPSDKGFRLFEVAYTIEADGRVVREVLDEAGNPLDDF